MFVFFASKKFGVLRKILIALLHSIAWSNLRYLIVSRGLVELPKLPALPDLTVAPLKFEGFDFPIVGGTAPPRGLRRPYFACVRRHRHMTPTYTGMGSACFAHARVGLETHLCRNIAVGRLVTNCALRVYAVIDI